MFRLGILINPMAGLGGPAALKGSDAKETAILAAQRGVCSRTPQRLEAFFTALDDYRERIEVWGCDGAMGLGDIELSGWHIQRCYQPHTPCSAADTVAAARVLHEAAVDLLIFVGGDGTARDIYTALGEHQAVLGLPAGVKMHSGVFAVTPVAAASVVKSLIDGRLVAARLAEVRDIDEAAFQQGQVRTRYFGEMWIPDDQLLVQCVKCSGLPDDVLQLDELSAWLVETMAPDVLYVLGSGGTLFDLKQKLGLPQPTLLGVDLWCNGEQVGSDLHETALYEAVCQAAEVQLYLSVIGGQGVVLGRGNQQISARILQQVGLDALNFVATPQKLQVLGGRPLVVDSGDDQLDRQLAGFHKVITGYDEAIFYEIRYLG